MNPNLESADKVVKLLLAFSIILSYALGIIQGPVGVLLVILSTTLMLFFGIRLVFRWITMD